MMKTFKKVTIHLIRRRKKTLTFDFTPTYDRIQQVCLSKCAIEGKLPGT